MCSEADIVFAIDTARNMYFGDDGYRIRNVSAALLGCHALVTYMQISDFLYSIVSFNDSSNNLQKPIWATRFGLKEGILCGVYAFDAGEAVLTQ